MSHVIDAMFERKVAANDYVIRQGDDGDNFYVIETGRFDVFKSRGPNDPEPGQRVLTYDGRGSFGELALMYNQPRAASVIAATDGVLWAMDRQSFRRTVLRSAYRKRQVLVSFTSRIQVFMNVPNPGTWLLPLYPDFFEPVIRRLKQQIQTEE
jgi:cAMP-dependent protein kinase regulator